MIKYYCEFVPTNRRGGGSVGRVAGYNLPHCLRITIGDEPSCRRVAHAIGQFKEGAR